MTHEPIRRGRPRSDAAHAAILTATIDVLADRGPHDASVDEIAARAHAGKDTIYRRWPHKMDLIRAALDWSFEGGIELPDSGSLVDDIDDYVTRLARLLRDRGFGPVVISFAVDGHADAGASRWTAGFWRARLAELETMVQRAVERGEVPAERARLLPVLAMAQVCYRLLIPPAGAAEPDLRAMVTAILA
jgi:AcrR family transcriptional regulator